MSEILKNFQIGDIIAFYGLGGDLETHSPKRVIYSKRLHSLACQNKKREENFSNKTKKEQGYFWGSLDDCFIPPEHCKIKKIGFQDCDGEPRKPLPEEQPYDIDHSKDGAVEGLDEGE